MESKLNLLRYACINENVATLQAPDLVHSALVYTLDGRNTQGLIERFHEIAAQDSPPRPDNRFRHMACMQAAADVLGEDYATRLSDDDIVAGVAVVSGKDYLWPTFLDLALGLSLRYGHHGAAKALASERLRAPLGADLHTMVQLLNQESSGQVDAMTTPELGHLGGLAAVWMGGKTQAATSLALVAANGAAWSPSRLVEQAKVWDACIGQIDREPLRWAIDPETKGIRATLTVRAAGDLHGCAGWILEDLVYLWPEHIDRLMKRQVPLEDIHGAKTRKSVLEAVKKGGIEAVVDLQGATMLADQLAALVKRQNAGLAWIRANHVELSDQPSGIRLIGAPD